MIKQQQKRLILSHMGINQWVSHNSHTIHIDAVTTDENNIKNSVDTQSKEVINSDSMMTNVRHEHSNHYACDNDTLTVKLTADFKNQPNDYSSLFSASDEIVSCSNLSESNPVYDDDNESVVVSHTELSDTGDYGNAPQKLEQEVFVAHTADSTIVTPFNIHAVWFNDWVLLLDIKYLNEHENKLWCSLCSVLCLQADTLSFPICHGMQSFEVAQATLAGFLYKLTHTKSANVIMLNDCLDVELTTWLTQKSKNFAQIPLSSMLITPQKKQQLWQLINC